MSERPFLRAFVVASIALAALFTVVGADPAGDLPALAAMGFWTVHVSAGLLLAIAVARVLNRSTLAGRLPSWVRLLLAGLGGAALFTPIALGLDRWFPATDAAGPEDVLDHWEAAGGAAAWLAEYLHVAPSYVLSWLLLNLAARFGAPAASGTVATPAERASPVATEPAGAAATGSGTPAPADPVAEDAIPADGGGFLESLPPAIGRDVVEVAADLHYLQVYTTRGRAMLLGSLASVERELGAEGTRVHRSHWVAHRHVRRISRSSAGWYCELSTGKRVPISRRRVQTVRSRLGSDFVVE